MEQTIHLKVNGEDRELTVRPRPATRRPPALRPRPDGHQGGLLGGRLWRLHSLMDGKNVARASSRPSLPTGPTSSTIEGIADDGKLAPVAASVYRLRWLPVRHLHARPDYGRQGSAR